MLYISIRGQDDKRKATFCDTLTGREVDVTRNEAEEIILQLTRFLVGPDSRLPFQVRAMVRKEESAQLNKRIREAREGRIIR